MGSIAKYSGISTKTRTMSGRLLSLADYKNLAASDSITEAISQLKKYKSYVSVFECEGIDESQLHRGDIERNLHIAVYRDFEKLYKFANSNQRKFLKMYFMKFEISILKYCFRVIFDHRKYQINLPELQNIFKRRSILNLEQLVLVKTVSELIKMLEDTPYYTILNHLVPVNKELSLYDYETALDMFYFNTVWKDKSKMKDKNGEKIITKTLGSRLDLLNLQWIYRSKKYYKINPEQIYSVLIPINYQIKEKELNEFVTAKDLEVFESLLEKTKYAKVDLGVPLLGDRMDEFYYHYMDRIHTRAIKQEPYAMSILDSYMEKKEDEVRKISTVIEGIRYGLSQEEILSYIIPSKKGDTL
jgi:Archaeal/vacuolar-type H+-ATPase subunit C